MTKRSKSQLEQRVLNNWGAWRLVLSDRGFTFTEVFHNMTPQEIDEANIALNRQIEAENAEMKKASKR